MINILSTISIMTFQLKFPVHPCASVNRSVLCNCGIEAENNFLLESLPACHDTNSKLIMYFTVDTAFVSYHDSLNNSTYLLKVPILPNRTTYEQILPISLPPPEFDCKLLTVPKTLKDFVHQIQ